VGRECRKNTVGTLPLRLTNTTEDLEDRRSRVVQNKTMRHRNNDP
jgi:hypothetical protein